MACHFLAFWNSNRAYPYQLSSRRGSISHVANFGYTRRYYGYLWMGSTHQLRSHP